MSCGDFIKYCQYVLLTNSMATDVAMQRSFGGVYSEASRHRIAKRAAQDDTFEKALNNVDGTVTPLAAKSIEAAKLFIDILAAEAAKEIQ
jgi:hypothetical protein